MTSGLNIEWSTFMASMLVGPLVFNGRAGIWHIRKCLPWRGYPYVPRHISLYRNDFGGKISQLGYSEPLMITLLTNFLTLHRLLVRYPSVFPFLDYGCTQAPSRIKLPHLKHADERQPLSSVCYYKSYLPSRSSFHIWKQYVFQSFDPGRRWY